MKISLFFLSLMLQMNSDIYAVCKDTIPTHNGVGTVYLFSGARIKGYILSTDDSTIWVIQKKYWRNGLLSQQRSIPSTQITIITKTSRAKFSALEAFATGAIGGMLLGFSIGFSDCDDPDGDCSFLESLFTPGSLKKGFTVGIVLGGIVSIAGLFSRGRKRKKFYLNGSRDAFLINKNEILSY